MENLERDLDKADPRIEDTKTLVEMPLYEGFQKIEDWAYRSGTSIKYWM